MDADERNWLGRDVPDEAGSWAGWQLLPRLPRASEALSIRLRGHPQEVRTDPVDRETATEEGRVCADFFRPSR